MDAARSITSLSLALGLLLGGCGSGGGFDPATPHLRMDFEADDADFYAAPFPGAHRFTDGVPNVAGFPNPRGTDFVNAMLDLVVADSRGAGVSSAVYFESTALIDQSTLPDVEGSTHAESPVFLVSVSEGGELGPRHPIHVGAVDTAANQQLYAPPFLLGLLPYQGIPLREDTLYAAVVLDDVLTDTGAPLARPPALRRLLAGQVPPGLDATHAADYLAAAQALADAGVPLARVVGMTAFRTGAPTQELIAAREQVLGAALPTLSAFTPREVFDTYCVYEASVDMPVFQSGTPPYRTTGGGWVHDASGALVLDHTETARVFVTIPRSAPGTDGYPTTIFVRTGGGGDRPLVDRGVRGENGGPPLAPGTGPAQEFAQVGVAGISVDGPHGGVRNVTASDEQLLIFNITNPPAMRDNIRQSALELVLLANLVGDVSIDTSACPGAAQPATLDASRLAMMGHSMGATIGPLAASIEPSIRALLLSGAGGSWIDNVLYKERPLPILPLARIIVGYTRTTQALTLFDPVLALLLQWAGEGSDPQTYAHRVVDAPLPDASPRHVLMMQGIVDTYIFPSIANGLSLPLGLELAGSALESTDPRSARFTSIADLLPLVGRSTRSYPAGSNRNVAGTLVTAVVTQHPEDGIEDGHEVMFQTEGPKHQYRCFLDDFAHDRVPVVPAPDSSGCD
ncbi:MAG: hypothetical protein H6725_04785 [Sandaracinaceae bacterium]|nr:hypothetical protein [Sandaracinaceae bacterium]